MLTEIDLDRNNKLQAEEELQKEVELLELNKYCSDKSVPDDCKAEAIIDYQKKYGRL
jgi:hypothetical protein